MTDKQIITKSQMIMRIAELSAILQGKEQECNKLYIQLKADEEYHKEKLKTLRKIIKNKEERNIELYKENNKLKQTLAEIKEIAQAYEDTYDSECKQLCCTEILQLINEVKL